MKEGKGNRAWVGVLVLSLLVFAFIYSAIVGWMPRDRIFWPLFMLALFGWAAYNALRKRIDP